LLDWFTPHDTTELRSRYRNQRIFYLQTWWNVWLSYREGFLLPVDVKTILDEAKAYDGRLPGRNKRRHTNSGRSQ
jgi:hypothetical protein